MVGGLYMLWGCAHYASYLPAACCTHAVGVQAPIIASTSYTNLPRTCLHVKSHHLYKLVQNDILILKSHFLIHTGTCRWPDYVSKLVSHHATGFPQWSAQRGRFLDPRGSSVHCFQWWRVLQSDKWSSYHAQLYGSSQQCIQRQLAGVYWLHSFSTAHCDLGQSERSWNKWGWLRREGRRERDWEGERGDREREGGRGRGRKREREKQWNVEWMAWTYPEVPNTFLASYWLHLPIPTFSEPPKNCSYKALKLQRSMQHCPVLLAAKSGDITQ